MGIVPMLQFRAQELAPNIAKFVDHAGYDKPVAKSAVLAERS